MIRDLEPYPEYKDSIDQWLGEVPEHWNEVPIKHVSRVDNSGAYGDEPETNEITLPVATTAQIDSDGRFHVARMPRRSFDENDVARYGCNPNDILIVKSSGSAENIISGKAGFVDADTPEFVFSNFLMRLVPYPERVEPAFLYALIISSVTRERVQRMVSTTTYPNLKVDEYVNAIAPFPPLEEQKQIASFLDYETAKIDALIEKQQQLIALLGEKRQAVISHAVTKGLNPDATPETIENRWFGRYPEHWELISVRNLLRKVALEIQDGNHGESHPTSADFTDSGIPFLMAADMNDGQNDLENCHFITERQATSLRIPPAMPGDVFLSHKGNQLGEVTMVPEKIDFPYLVLTPQITYYRVDQKLISRDFLFFVLRSKGFQGQLWYLASIQATRPYVGLLAQRDLLVVLPPIAEQKEIAKKLQNEVGQFDELLDKAEGAIELLQERRTALISAAVTGKIDVRGWKPPSSDVELESEMEVA